MNCWHRLFTPPLLVGWVDYTYVFLCLCRVFAISSSPPTYPTCLRWCCAQPRHVSFFSGRYGTKNGRGDRIDPVGVANGKIAGRLRSWCAQVPRAYLAASGCLSDGVCFIPWFLVVFVLEVFFGCEYGTCKYVVVDVVQTGVRRRQSGDRNGLYVGR